MSRSHWDTELIFDIITAGSTDRITHTLHNLDVNSQKCCSPSVELMRLFSASLQIWHLCQYRTWLPVLQAVVEFHSELHSIWQFAISLMHLSLYPLSENSRRRYIVFLKQVAVWVLVLSSPLKSVLSPILSFISCARMREIQPRLFDFDQRT